MRKLIRTALDNRNRIATAALVATGTTMTTLASAQTSLDGSALATGAVTSAQSLMASGGPAVFGLVGIATGAIWLLNRVRSLG